MMEQVDYFASYARKVNPESRFEVSLWPIWALEPKYDVRYRDAFFKLLSQYVQVQSRHGQIIAVSDSVTHPDTTLRLANTLGIGTNGFVFPTNVESGCALLTPMLEFLAITARQALEHNVQSIHHMRIEEPMKFANTFFASRFYWDVQSTPEDALRHYAGWIANTNRQSAERLQEALLLLDRFMCLGANRQDHAAIGTKIRDLVETAAAGLEPDRTKDMEWLLTTSRAIDLIGRAIAEPDRSDQLSEEFATLMSNSPTFATSRTPLKKYVAWITKGWNQEHF